MRKIKASEVKPGMEVQWTHAGITRKCVGSVVESASPRHGVNLRTFEGGAVHIPKDVEVTVLSEPHPEEPTELGVKARVYKGRFVRLREGLAGSKVWFEEGTGYRWTWDDLCEMGPVTVVPDQGWTVPTDAPEVPERIEEWPEDDTALRKYRWRDSDGDTWTWVKTEDKWECRSRADTRLGSWFGPFTRVTEEPTPEVPDRIEEWPEDDTALRAYKWRDTDGDAWYWHLVDGGWGYNHATFPQPFPECFPMTRVTDV